MNEGFIQGCSEVPKPSNACPVAQRLRQRPTERKGDVFYGVMVIYPRVSGCLHSDVQQSMRADLLQQDTEALSEKHPRRGTSTPWILQVHGLLFWTPPEGRTSPERNQNNSHVHDTHEPCVSPTLARLIPLPITALLVEGRHRYGAGASLGAHIKHVVQEMNGRIHRASPSTVKVYFDINLCLLCLSPHTSQSCCIRIPGVQLTQ